jgi:nitroimidazol reductase NimA-like FMN-containing flavoprotein (pyridoxamine 5'-phosphate oxidase superfamily)
VRRDTVDLDDFLSRPLVARVATPGPTLRPVWYLWEDGSFWWITDMSNRLVKSVLAGEPVVVLIDECNLATGEVIAVTARGTAELVPLDSGRAKRKFRRYLGEDDKTWDPGFLASLDLPTTKMIKLTPTTVTAKNMSYRGPVSAV